jgi:hypothetical protein
MGILAVTTVLSLRAGPPTTPNEVPSGVGNVFSKDKDQSRQPGS